VTNLNAFRIPPPKDWQEFERLCRSLWALMWRDPNTQLNGRGGQPQHGVDVFGKPPEASRWSGVQCKGKEERYGQQVTETELRTEVQKAKSFEPPLGEWILATTAQSDVEIQRIAREISDEHQAQGLFSVTVLGWDEIVARLTAYPQVAQAHGLPGAVQTVDLTPHASRELLDPVMELGADLQDQLRQIKQMQAHMQGLLEAKSAPLDGLHDQRIDEYRTLISEHQPRAALKLLESFREKQWDSASAHIRFRILANISACYLALGEFQTAADYALRAYECKPDDPKAAANRVFAYLFLNEPVQAMRVATAELATHPANPQVWQAYITAASRQQPPADIGTVPATVREELDVLLALGHYHRAHRELEAGAQSLRAALAQKPDSYVYLFVLGGLLLERVARDGKLYRGAPYSQEEMAIVREAAESLERAWLIVHNTDLAGSSVHMARDAATAWLVLGEPQRSNSLIASALARAPNDPELLTMKLRLALMRGEVANARDALRALDPGRVPDFELLSAMVAQSDGQVDIALAHVEAHLHSQPKSEERVLALCLYADLLWRADPEHADTRFKPWLEDGVEIEPRVIVHFARIAYEANHAETAGEYMDRARPLVEASDEERDRLVYGEALAEMHRDEEAVAYFRRASLLGNDSPSLRSYLQCLLRLDQRRQLAEVIAQLPDNLRAKTHFQWVQGAAAEAAGDLPRAAEHFRHAMEAAPKQLIAGLRWAEVSIRLGRNQEVDEWLARQALDPLSLPQDELLYVASLLLQLDRVDRATELLYHGWRRFPNDHQINTRLAFVVMLRGRDDWALPPDQPLAADMACALDDGHGTVSTFVIESIPENQLQRDEISLSHPLAQRLLGHRAGDEITTYDGHITTHTQRILWTRHKYAHAALQIMQTYNTRFPEGEAILAVAVDPTNPAGQLERLLREFDRSAHVERVLKEYRERRLPLCALSHFLGGTALDVWRKLASDVRVPMPVCDGSAPERTAAIEALNSSRQLLIEPVALLSLHVLGQAELLTKLPTRPCITQSALYLFDQQIALSRTHADGYTKVFEQNGEKYRVDVTAEAVAAEIREWQRVRDWARQHCEIVSAIPPSDLAPNVAEALNELLGQAHYDALLAAHGGQFVLFSDDYWLRGIAEHQFWAPGIWSQAFLMWAHDRKWITFSEYVDGVVSLAQWRYTFTSVSAEALMLVAASRDAQMLARFSALSAELNLAVNRMPELIQLTVQFLAVLWSSRWDTSMKERLTYALLNGIAPQNSPNCHQFLQKVIAHATAMDIPTIAVHRIIDWMQGHFILHDFRNHIDRS
jgi:tetratricopeptide (TPR) repeat protein